MAPRSLFRFVLKVGYEEFKLSGDEDLPSELSINLSNSRSSSLDDQQVPRRMQEQPQVLLLLESKVKLPSLKRLGDPSTASCSSVSLPRRNSWTADVFAP